MSLAIQLKGHSSNRKGCIHFRTNNRKTENVTEICIEFNNLCCLFLSSYAYGKQGECNLYNLPRKDSVALQIRYQISAKAK